MEYQLVPPHDHQQNLAKKAIQTFKDHFIAILCGTDKAFPLNLWDRLLPQAEHTLNMLRPARMTPTISAYAYLWGQHDYNICPIRMQGGSPRCTINQRDMGTTHDQQILHWQCSGTVSLPRDLHQRHMAYAHLQHCVFQAQIPYHADNHPSRCAHQGSGQPDRSNCRSNTTPKHNSRRHQAIDENFQARGRKSQNNATAQRVLKEGAQAQRVLIKATTTATPASPLPPLKVKYPGIDLGVLCGIPVISQDNNSPAAHTRLQWKVRMLTQDYLFNMMDTPGLAQPFKPQQAASH
jgi:hypothetical protein